MATIPDGQKILTTAASVNTTYGGSDALKALNTWYTMEDIVETVNVAQGEEVSYTVSGGTSGTQPTFSGPPLFSGSYIRIGKLVHFQIQVDMDNITNFGTGQYYVTLPFTSEHGYMFREGCLHDISTSREYHISGHVYTGSNVLELFTSDTQGNVLYDFPFSSTEPIVLNVADNFHLSGTYMTNEPL
jgi:hypothetical protein